MKKKIISIAISASMLFSACPVFASTISDIGIIGGADRPTKIYVTNDVPSSSYTAPEALYSPELMERYGIEGSASIYYNSQYLEPAIIIGSRTMLPFRSFLEAVGATVSYDDATRYASAVRNDTTVGFCLDSEIITITDEAGSREIVMDVLPVIIEGHSYVPIRFLSEAFDMQVGWSGYEQTALISDREKYLETLRENCPNISKLFGLSMNAPENSKTDLSGKADFSLDASTYVWYDNEDGTTTKEAIESDTLNLNASLDISSYTSGANSEADSAFSLSYKDSDGNTIDLKESSVDIITKDNVFYIKTDIIDKLAKSGIDVGGMEEYISKDTWYKLSVDNLVAFLSSYTGEAVNPEMFNTTSSTQYTDADMFFEAMLDSYSEIELTDTYDVDTVTTAVYVITMVDRLFKIEQTADHSYDVSFSLTTDELYRIVEDYLRANDERELGYNLSEEELKEVMEEAKHELNGFTFNITFSVKIENGYTVAENAVFDISYKADDGSLDMDVTLTSVTDPNVTAKEIPAPEDSIDIFKVLYGI